MLRVYFDERQSVQESGSFSPSPSKPALVVESWKKLGIPIELVSFSPVTRDQLKQVHQAEYVDQVLDCEIENGFGNRSEQVASALPWVAGSMVAAALDAYHSKRPTFSPTSGAHHAGYDYGGSFCTFNTLVLAAVQVHNQGDQQTGRQIGIIDLDCHHGDGTDHIIQQLGIGYIKHYSFGSKAVSAGKDAQRWLAGLASDLKQFKGVDLLIFNAGVDPHINDPLGGILTTKQMRLRDRIVYRVASELRIPIVTALAGGYQRDKNGTISPVLRLHDATLKECDRVFRKRRF